ncbi:MAG: hypothetical protein QM831_44210 [Kofleriaceae bacterium]
MRALLIVAAVVQTASAKPHLAWTYDKLADTGHRDYLVAITPTHDVAVADYDGARLLRDGKVVWSVAGSFVNGVLGKTAIATFDVTSQNIRMFELATGKEIPVELHGTPYGLGVRGDDFVVQLSEHPDAAKPRFELDRLVTTGRTTKLFDLPADAFSAEWIYTTADRVAFVQDQHLYVTDTHGNRKCALTGRFPGVGFDIAGNTLAYSDSVFAFVAPLDKLTGTIDLTKSPKLAVATATKKLVDNKYLPGAIPNPDAQAYEVHDLPNTINYFGPTTWSLAFPSIVMGPPTGDAKYVYASRDAGDKGKGDYVFAIDRATGKLAWEIDVGASGSGVQSKILTRDGYVVVEDGKQLFVIAP